MILPRFLCQAPQVVWSRGWYDRAIRSNPGIPPAYYLNSTESLAPQGFFARYFSNAQDVVWVRLGSRRREPNDLSAFSNEALPAIKKRICLITTDGDCNVPSDLQPEVARALLDNPLIERWYTQNLDGSLDHPKFRPLPIGLDLHTFHPPSEKLEIMHRVLGEASPWVEREEKVLMDITSLCHRERETVARLLYRCKHVHTIHKRLSFEDAMREYARFRYGVSVRGNGLDCHRTWELLFMNTVPIVKNGPLDRLFVGLPVVSVGDWEEVSNPGNLRRWTSSWRLTMRGRIHRKLDRRRFAPELFE